MFGAEFCELIQWQIMWQRGYQIGWQFRWVTKKSDSIVTKNCDKFGDSKNMSPTLSPDWSQNTVNHQIGHQICHKICHQTPWGSYMQKWGHLRHSRAAHYMPTGRRAVRRALNLQHSWIIVVIFRFNPMMRLIKKLI